MGNAIKKLEGALTAADRFRQGCMLVFWNLFLGAFCMWGVYAAFLAYRLEQTGVVTTGVVRALEESSSEGGVVYSPVVEFEAQGRIHSFEGGNASYPPAYAVGERVEVLYDPADPSTAQINKFSERWLFPILIIPAMLITAGILNFFLLRALRRGESIDE